MTTIASALQAVKARIARAAEDCGRDPEEIRLVAVSKTFAAGCVREAWAAGQASFGENYAQEALAKMDSLADLPLEWHFIGPIQSNKTRAIAERFAWVHGIERQKVAERLAEARPAALPPLQVCIQVNVSGESSKSGIPPAELAGLAERVATLPGLRLRGLMAIPEPTGDATLQRARFAELRRLKECLVAGGIPLDTLSMGMSSDLEVAIAEGATLVRVGTAIFGQRAARARP